MDVGLDAIDMTWLVRAPATVKLDLVSRPGRRIRVSALGWGLLFSLRTKSPDVGVRVALPQAIALMIMFGPLVLRLFNYPDALIMDGSSSGAAEDSRLTSSH